MLSRVRLLATPWTAAHQAPPSMGFSRQEYWSGVPLPSPKALLQTTNHHNRHDNSHKGHHLLSIHCVLGSEAVGHVLHGNSPNPHSNTVKKVSPFHSRTYILGLGVAKTPPSHCRGPGSIPDQGARSLMPQLKIPRGATKIDILYTATKTRHSQMNTLKKKKKNTYIPCTLLRKWRLRKNNNVPSVPR